MSNDARVSSGFDVREKRLELVDKAREICRNGTWAYMMTHVNNKEGECIGSGLDRKSMISNKGKVRVAG